MLRDRAEDRHSAGKAIISSQTSRLRKIAFQVVIAMAVIVFSGAWYYPFEGISTSVETPDAPFAVPFRYVFWLIIVVLSGLHFTRLGVIRFSIALTPFIPLIVVALFASLLGVYPLASLRAFAFMICMVLVGIILPIEVHPRFLFRCIIFVLGILIILSVALCLAVPSYAVHGIEDRLSWRGLFVFKQAFGWAAAISIILTYGLRSHISRSMSAIILTFAIVSLVYSNNKGASFAVVFASGYLLIIERLNAKIVGFTSKFLVAILILALIVYAIAFPVSFVPEILGRDATLTGRTVVWARFWDLVLPYWMIGAGPSAFTLPNNLTIGITADFFEFGAITQPHNTYLAVFGEAGILGLIFYVGLLVYFILIRPFISSSIYAVVAASLGLLIAIVSCFETRSPLTYTLDWFLLIALYSASLHRNVKGKLFFGSFRVLE